MGCCASKNAVADEQSLASRSIGAGGKGATGPTSNLFRVLSLSGLSTNEYAEYIKTPGGKGGTGLRSSAAGSLMGDGTNGGAAGGAGGAAGQGADGAEQFDTVKSESAVKVAVMVRPLLDHESGCKDVVQLMPPGKIKLPKKANGSGTEDSYPFDFDKVLKVDNASSSKEMFATLVLPVVERYCQGFNGTVLAYGQTGSGKTYTMGTSSGSKDMLAKEPQGVIPRALAVLFQYVQLASQMYDVTVKVTYIEIYNEQIFDLLRDGGSGGKGSKLEIREKPDGDIVVDGASAVAVRSREDVARLLEQGNALRSTAAHKMNAESSRSHAIVTLAMEQRAKDVKAVPDDLRFLRSKLHLVDLAGSERQKDTGATGERFAEGVNINKGLLELGNVINALTEGKKRNHVPYRNSKLTRVLQDSLGGNSETLFIACCSPADVNHEQTLNTLRYASRARNIRNNLRLNNKLSLEEEVEYLRGLVAALQQENGELKNKLVKAGVPVGPSKGW